MGELELTPTEELEESMLAAANGGSAALRRFYELLAQAKFFVPQRKQKAALKNIADYPNDFFNFLALNFDQHVFVPVFLRLEGIAEWAGNNLEYREIESAKLFELMPSDWWIIVNPGAEVHKEISAWEIARLKHGVREIDELVAELEAEQLFEGVSIETPAEAEFADLKAALTRAARNMPELKTLYLLREKGHAAGDQIEERLLVGFELSDSARQESDRVGRELQLVADQLQIGAEKTRVLSLADGSGSSKGIFMGVAPFFSKSSSPFSRLLSWLGLR